ncbi:DUF1127 domain-containing protein [Bosea sp. TAF32]|uniref:DUF1127 domain-containing protein n=1 Tax=Bosea sp. TAF32 TaxID=3237482 RepID=UPI003F8F148E
MAMLLSAIDRPDVTDGSGRAFRLFEVCRRGIERYFARREALARLREFSDSELLDIGLTRGQIEPAIRGLDISIPDWPRR